MQITVIKRRIFELPEKCDVVSEIQVINDVEPGVIQWQKPQWQNIAKSLTIWERYRTSNFRVNNRIQVYHGCLPTSEKVNNLRVTLITVILQKHVYTKKENEPMKIQTRSLWVFFFKCGRGEERWRLHFCKICKLKKKKKKSNTMSLSDICVDIELCRNHVMMSSCMVHILRSSGFVPAGCRLVWQTPHAAPCTQPHVIFHYVTEQTSGMC